MTVVDAVVLSVLVSEVEIVELRLDVCESEAEVDALPDTVLLAELDADVDADPEPEVDADVDALLLPVLLGVVDTELEPDVV